MEDERQGRTGTSPGPHYGWPRPGSRTAVADREHPGPVEMPSTWDGYGMDGYPGKNPGDGVPAAGGRTEPVAVASIWCSAIGIVLPPAAVAGVVFGCVGLRRITRSAPPAGGKSLATAGVVVGSLAAVAWIVLLVVLVQPSPVVTVQDGPPSATALAQREPITGSSYPSGWVGAGRGSGVQGMNYWSGLTGRPAADVASCLGGTTTPGDPAPAEAEDQAYVDTRAPSSSTYGSSLWMADVVDVYPTIAGAVLDAEAARNPKALACLFRCWGPGLSGPNSDLGAGLGQGEVDSTPTVLDRTAPVMPGDDSDNEWSAHYTYHGTQGTIYVDWVTVQRGRSESVLWLSNLGSPVPDRLIAEMTAAAQHQLTGSGS